MSGDETLYSILAVRDGASAAEIDKAYRQRALKVHPDAGGDAASFHALAHAYAVLSDPERRSAYDASGYQGELVPGDLAAKAMERIEALVASVLDSDIPFETVDLVAAIRETLARQQSEISSGTAALERQAQRAETMARRFHRASGDNPIRAALERRAAETRENAEKTRHEAAIFAKAIALLVDYSFEHAAPAEEAPRKPAAATRR